MLCYLVCFFINTRPTFLFQTQTQMHLLGRKYKKTYNFLDVHKHKTIKMYYDQETRRRF